MRVFTRRAELYALETDVEAEDLYVMSKLAARGLVDVKIRVYYTAMPTSWCMMPVRLIDIDKSLEEYLTAIIEDTDEDERDTLPSPAA